MSELGDFLARQHIGLTIADRALIGAAPDHLSLWEIAALLAAPEVLSADRGACAVDALKRACVRGDLRARTGGTPESPEYWIHRDHARRYFGAMGLDPDPGSPLACWLRGRSAAECKTLRPDQQDRADFQQLALEYWERNPTATITGPDGAAAKVAGAYGRNYQPRTLEGWAREVAPQTVRGRPGRRPKISADPKK